MFEEPEKGQMDEKEGIDTPLSVEGTESEQVESGAEAVEVQAAEQETVAPETSNRVEAARRSGESMEHMLEDYEVGNIFRGKAVEGKIVSANDDGWLVDISYKCEGFLPKNEWTHRVLVDKADLPQVGDTVRVQVTKIVRGEETQVFLSRWRLEFDERWRALEEAVKANGVIQVVGLRKVKGGIIVDAFGIEGFVPISHLAEEGRFLNQAKFIGEPFEVKVLEMDKRKRRLVLSRRILLEEEAAKKREEFYNSVSIGDILEGTVSSITSFGAFVNLGAIEGLVHVSELSWRRSTRPRDVVKKGERVSVKLIGLDKESGRVSLSIKQAQPDPWDMAIERWKVGDRVVGKVTNLTDFGAFVEIEPGVEGLIHISDLSWSRIKHPRDVLKKNQQVEVQILEVDPSRKRISLGYKQLHDPWLGVEERYHKGDDVTVKVVRLVEFGAFAQLEEGVEGLIHVSQIARRPVNKPSDVLSEGEEVTARILDVNPKERRIRLSIKATQEEEERRNRRGRGEERRNREAKAEGAEFQNDEPSVTIGELIKGQLSE